MGYIPQDAEWYIAELVMEITVQGARYNVVHRNLILINAHSPDEAYSKAIDNGKNAETDYTNPRDQRVTIRFRGVSRLDVIYDPLEDGAEVQFEEQLDVSEPEILRMIPPKDELNVFTSANPGRERDPDYSSKEVVKEAVRMLERKRGT